MEQESESVPWPPRRNTLCPQKILFPLSYLDIWVPWTYAELLKWASPTAVISPALPLLICMFPMHSPLPLVLLNILVTPCTGVIPSLHTAWTWGALFSFWGSCFSVFQVKKENTEDLFSFLFSGHCCLALQGSSLVIWLVMRIIVFMFPCQLPEVTSRWPSLHHPCLHL
jgi:hypothetical protein